MLILYKKVNPSILETYLLNSSQILHMLILAVVVPWYIGLSAYGIFAASITVPGLIQSPFEMICVSILSQQKRIDALRGAVLFIAVPALVFLVIGNFYLLPLARSMLVSATALTLLVRSYVFSISISQGGLTNRIVKSEFITLGAYLTVISISYLFSLRNETVPLLMIIASNTMAIAFLFKRSYIPVNIFKPRLDTTPPVSLRTHVKAASLTTFEDGYLTMSPLLLAALFSPIDAGHFRVFVSISKAAYKLFPFRYEIVLRELGNISFRSLAVSTSFFSLAPPLVAGTLRMILPPNEHTLFLILFAFSGATAACLAMFPAACSTDARVLHLALLGLAAIGFSALLVGLTGFVITFGAATAVLLLASIAAVRKASQTKLGLQEGG
jgi:hypothetical protein